MNQSLLRDAEAKYEIFGQLNEPFVGFDDENPPKLTYKSIGIASFVQSKSQFQPATASQRPISVGLLGCVWAKTPSKELYERFQEDAAKKSPEKISDPAEAFFHAYEQYRKAEQLGVGGSTKEAVEKLRGVLRSLEQIESQHPNWQPMVVDFRKKRTLEALAKLPSTTEDHWH
ncbi:MAG: hypothetical protein ACKO39_13520 [Chthoniobacterales bacterium]